MAVLFAAEHLLLLLSVIITFAIDDMPKAVKVSLLSPAQLEMSHAYVVLEEGPLRRSKADVI